MSGHFCSPSRSGQPDGMADAARTVAETPLVPEVNSQEDVPGRIWVARARCRRRTQMPQVLLVLEDPAASAVPMINDGIRLGAHVTCQRATEHRRRQ